MEGETMAKEKAPRKRCEACGQPAQVYVGGMPLCRLCRASYLASRYAPERGGEGVYCWLASEASLRG